MIGQETYIFISLFRPAVYTADDVVPAASNVYGASPRGRVGPVYTFVKTDPQANFKWGVRHVAGVQYGRR